MAKGRKFYTVWEGHHPGVYDTWEDAQEQIIGFKGAKYKSFPSSEEAAEAFRSYTEKNDRTILSNILREIHKYDNQQEDASKDNSATVKIDKYPCPKEGWAVDASCLGNPGVMEYQGVDLATGQSLFKMGPFEQGTNNVGEFLAIIHAAALMLQKGINVPIYSDSVTAISWVKHRQVKTTLVKSDANEKVFDLLQRAVIWLTRHVVHVPLLKWDTEAWGEIPADYGRK